MTKFKWWTLAWLNRMEDIFARDHRDLEPMPWRSKRADNLQKAIYFLIGSFQIFNLILIPFNFSRSGTRANLIFLYKLPEFTPLSHFLLMFQKFWPYDGTESEEESSLRNLMPNFFDFWSVFHFVYCIWPPSQTKWVCVVAVTVKSCLRRTVYLQIMTWFLK